ncbi:uncharacterized protein [Dysidea avara]|uniref:uncharacterized protein isoform X2 n=1 Tax=Dysidea avara TaxID=196820 RepID=UPI0033183B27
MTTEISLLHTRLFELSNSVYNHADMINNINMKAGANMIVLKLNDRKSVDNNDNINILAAYKTSDSNDCHDGANMIVLKLNDRKSVDNKDNTAAHCCKAVNMTNMDFVLFYDYRNILGAYKTI